MRKLSVMMGTLSAAAIAYWAAVIAVLPFFRSDFNPMINWISEYGVGSYGWVQNSAFVAGSLGILALVVGLAGAGPRSWMTVTGLVLLSVLVPGLIVSALFHVDLRGHPDTAQGMVHDLSAFANFLSAVVAQIFLAASFGDDPRWRPIRGPAVIIAAVCVAALTNQFLTGVLHLPWGGVSNRVFAASLTAWWLLAALRLRRLGQGLPTLSAVDERFRQAG